MKSLLVLNSFLLVLAFDSFCHANAKTPSAKRTIAQSAPGAEGVDSAEILYIGDSHSTGCFGTALEESIRGLRGTRNSVRVQSSTTCGSSTSSWMRTAGHSTNCGYRACSIAGSCATSNTGTSPSLATLLTQTRAKVTVVALGSNMLNSSRTNMDGVMNNVRQLAAQIKNAGSECVWVGPPQAKEQIGSGPYRFAFPIASYNDFVTRLREATTSAGCSFIDSNDKTDRNTLRDPMGLHYAPPHSCRWGQSVGAESAPILKGLLGIQ